MARRLLLASVLIAFASPALAAGSCNTFVAKDGSRVEYLNDGENSVIVKLAGKPQRACWWARTDEGTGQVIDCGGAPKRGFTDMSDDRQTLLYLGKKWARGCVKGN